MKLQLICVAESNLGIKIQILSKVTDRITQININKWNLKEINDVWIDVKLYIYIYIYIYIYAAVKPLLKYTKKTVSKPFSAKIVCCALVEFTL